MKLMKRILLIILGVVLMVACKAQYDEEGYPEDYPRLRSIGQAWNGVTVHHLNLTIDRANFLTLTGDSVQNGYGFNFTEDYSDYFLFFDPTTGLVTYGDTTGFGGGGSGGSGDMLRANNLSDVLSATTSRVNLGLGNVENTALSGWSGSAALITLGTIISGTWNGTAISNGYIVTALTGKTYNGVSLTTGGAITNFLNEQGGYSVPVGTTYTSSNGITLNGLNFEAGGALYKNTLVTGADTWYYSITDMFQINLNSVGTGGGVFINHEDVSADVRGLIIDDNWITVYDDTEIGIKYNGDFSLNWTDHSLVTMKWVTDNFGASSYTAGSGLTLNGTAFELGGTLDRNTIIDGDDTWYFQVNDVFQVNLYAKGNTGGINISHQDDALNSRGLLINDLAGIVLYDDSDVGIKNGGDWSLNATDRSLLDKAHIEALITAGGIGTDTIQIEDIAVIKTDWHSSVFGLGAGNTGDTAVMHTGAFMGGWKEYRDTIVPQEFEISSMGVDGDATVRLYYGPDPHGSGTAICAATQVTTTGGIVTITTFSVANIPSDNWIWCIMTTKAVDPTQIIANFAYTFE